MNNYNLLPIAIQMCATTIGTDLVAVQPMDLPIGKLSFLDFVYEFNKYDNYPGYEVREESRWWV